MPLYTYLLISRSTHRVSHFTKVGSRTASDACHSWDRNFQLALCLDLPQPEEDVGPLNRLCVRPLGDQKSSLWEPSSLTQQRFFLTAPKQKPPTPPKPPIHPTQPDSPFASVLRPGRLEPQACQQLGVTVTVGIDLVSQRADEGMQVPLGRPRGSNPWGPLPVAVGSIFPLSNIEFFGTQYFWPIAMLLLVLGWRSCFLLSTVFSALPLAFSSFRGPKKLRELKTEFPKIEKNHSDSNSETQADYAIPLKSSS